MGLLTLFDFVPILNRFAEVTGLPSRVVYFSNYFDCHVGGSKPLVLTPKRIGQALELFRSVPLQQDRTTMPLLIWPPA